MTEFNAADWSVFAVIIISSLLSLRRGFVKELLSLATWIIAVVIARSYNQNLQTLLESSLQNPMVRMAAAFGILFVGTLLVGSVISFLVGSLIKVTGLSTTDRLLGVLFGMARGLVLVLIAMSILRLTPLTEAPWWKKSVTIKQLKVIEKWSQSVFDTNIINKLGKLSSKVKNL